MDKRDHYEVLGVQRDVDAGGLKRAYRQLALRFHPDRNTEDPQAEAKFREATEAYGVLSDPNKRALYDLGGHEAVEGRGFGFEGEAFNDFGDLFGAISDMFGVNVGGAKQGPSRATRGDDLLHEMDISFESAALGVEREIHVPRRGACSECEGSGAAPGTSRKECPDCTGRGQVVMRQGFFSLSRPCGTCRGAGTLLEKQCEACVGLGRVEEERSLKVRVPAGIADGQRIRLAGEGDAGLLGGPRGDLYILVKVEKHPVFQRQNADLHVELPLFFSQVALGADVEVPTLEGPLPLHVPAGTEAGAVLTVQGRGIRRLGQSGSGDLFIHVRVMTPRKLSPLQERLFRDLAATERGGAEPEPQGRDESQADRILDKFA